MGAQREPGRMVLSHSHSVVPDEVIDLFNILSPAINLHGSLFPKCTEAEIICERAPSL